MVTPTTRDAKRWWLASLLLIVAWVALAAVKVEGWSWDNTVASVCLVLGLIAGGVAYWRSKPDVRDVARAHPIITTLLIAWALITALALALSLGNGR